MTGHAEEARRRVRPRDKRKSIYPALLYNPASGRPITGRLISRLPAAETGRKAAVPDVNCSMTYIGDVDGRSADLSMIKWSVLTARRGS